jgi:hypothetical protein
MLKTLVPIVDAVQDFVALPRLFVVATAVPPQVTPDGGLLA